MLNQYPSELKQQHFDYLSDYLVDILFIPQNTDIKSALLVFDSFVIKLD